jgi:hypothetical protein
MVVLNELVAKEEWEGKEVRECVKLWRVCSVVTVDVLVIFSRPLRP